MAEAASRPRSRRRFDYDRSLLPNPHLAALEPDEVADLESARPRTGQTIGYPAWNLLYYTMLCCLLPELEDPVVIETGTNRGLATVVMAQALKDLRLGGVVETVDRREDFVEAAKRNVAAAGLSDHVSFHVKGGIPFLREIAAETDHIDFAFIDDDHSCNHILRELDIVCPLIAARGGTIFFDNTSSGGVAEALAQVRARHGGDLIEFANASWSPPGNAIWQPDAK